MRLIAFVSLTTLFLYGCHKNAQPAQKSSFESVMDYPLKTFSTQNVSPSLALAKLAAAIRSQSDGKLLFKYSIIHPDNVAPKQENPPEYLKISMSLSNGTVAEALEIILRFGELNHYVTTDGLCVIFSGISHLPSEQLTQSFPIPQENLESFRLAAAANNNDLQNLFKSAGATFPPESFAYFVPDQGLVLTKNTEINLELTKAHIASLP
ncbi:MAG: hypothetical protein QM496_06155 [Verrucomicrobiota bacterium]